MPTIEFSTFDEEVAKDFKPVLAKSVYPEWWKKMKTTEMVRGSRTQTVRACPAMDDWLKMGYYIVAHKDIYVNLGGGEDVDVGATKEACVVNDHGIASTSHPSHQLGNSFIYVGSEEDGPVKDAFKLRHGWNVTTPAGYSLMYMEPFMFQNKHFAVWQGVIDTDTFNTNVDTCQVILYPKVTKSFVIPAGTPLVQVVPFKREEWTASINLYKHQTWFNNVSIDTTEIPAFTDKEMEVSGTQEKYKDTVRQGMEEHGRQPDWAMRGITHFGPYRTKGLWKEKGRFYKNIDTNVVDDEEDKPNPPPECPFHKGEE